MSDVSLHIQSERKKTQTLVPKKQPYYSLVRDEKDYDFMRRFLQQRRFLYTCHTHIVYCSDWYLRGKDT